MYGGMENRQYGITSTENKPETKPTKHCRAIENTHSEHENSWMGKALNRRAETVSLR